MKRRNFFKALGAVFAAPAAAKAAEPEQTYDWVKYGAFTDPYTGKMHIGVIEDHDFPTQGQIDAFDGYEYQPDGTWQVNADSDEYREMVSRKIDVLAKLNGWK